MMSAVMNSTLGDLDSMKMECILASPVVESPAPSPMIATRYAVVHDDLTGAVSIPMAVAASTANSSPAISAARDTAMADAAGRMLPLSGGSAVDSAVSAALLARAWRHRLRFVRELPAGGVVLHKGSINTRNYKIQVQN